MTVITKEIQENMSPDEARTRLVEGNKRFTQQSPLMADLTRQVKETASGQSPFAAILGCIDSRAAAEHVFDLGIGDVFNARIAGNVVNEDILGSLEYACHVAGAKLIVVLGHTSCGAVTSACNRVELGNVTPLLEKIKPAVLAVDSKAGHAGREDVDGGHAERGHVDRVAEENVHQSIAAIRKQSEILAQMEKSGEIMIAGAMYDVATGHVRFLD